MSETKDEIKARVLESLEAGKAGVGNKATKAQVKARLKDLEKSLDRRVREIRAKAVSDQRSVAEEFAREAERIGRDHGFEVDAYASRTTLSRFSGYKIFYTISDN